MKEKDMGNEQSGRPNGPRYVLALMTEAVLPRTDNYILNRLGEWAAQQTRTPVPRVLDTTEGVGPANGDERDDDVQIIGEDPPPPRKHRYSEAFGLTSSASYGTRTPRSNKVTPVSPSRDRSRFASYHKLPDIPNMDRGTYLEVLKRKLPNMYKKQAVNFKRISPRRADGMENGVSPRKSALMLVPISNLLDYGARKTLATQTECSPIVIDDGDSDNRLEPVQHSTRVLSGSDSWLQLFQKELEKLEVDRSRETAAKQRRVTEVAENRRKLQARISQPNLSDLAPQTPPLNSEMRACIDKALQILDDNRLIVEKFKLRITRGDLRKLEGLNWLNDSIINFYFAMLADRSERNENLPNVYSFSTFFYERLRLEGFKGVQRWTKRVDVFSKNILLIPVHLDMHWCLAVIDFRRMTIEYYDSMGGDNDECLARLLHWVQEESLDKRKVQFNTDGWVTANRKDIPQQQNGCDCGMFACRFAEYVTRGAKINFTQKDMGYFRMRTMFEILEKRLL
ncbi:sentrin-specific protease 1-like [Tropilaelaps mercedesae]|uniref:Sentrin-specific protease 1-like n=1 Tax=Tropilaelaps mercedesae TaxID=418985 RepID=A0A1V9XUH1_9ACAR|nr:sentrin-specific protease 1-like [Tropilaelaps mercedesae]